MMSFTFFRFFLVISAFLFCVSGRASLSKEQKHWLDELADVLVKPTSCQANNSQWGEAIAQTIDGKYATLWHTDWNLQSFAVSPQNPAILTYDFEQVSHIDLLRYVPRQSGGSNGVFRQVEVWMKLAGDSDYRLFRTYEWDESISTRLIDFQGRCLRPVSIQLRVLQGEGGFASCAEMEFVQKNPQNTSSTLFADEVYSELRPGVNARQIARERNPLARHLAQQLLQGNYERKYRVASFECFDSPHYLSRLWQAPGKYYDHLEGVTGINFQKGKHAVLVSGLPEGREVQLRIMAWYEGKIGQKFDGGNPQLQSFPLTNGVNIIDYTFDYPGLGYIAYFADGDAHKVSPIRVHFVDGEINGYLSPDKSNEEMHQLCKNAKSMFMDVVGKKAHCVWTAQGLYKHCKATDGKSLGYRQYMNIIDSLIAWEHNLLGFTKYKIVPRNHTMAYVNFTYYMFQGYMGVSYHVDQEPRVLNCRNIVNHDWDAIWGMSHEWGHQHQMIPYFCWSGTTEVTNNVNSYDNCLRMGYQPSEIQHGGGYPTGGAWKKEVERMLHDKHALRTSELRKAAYENAYQLAYSPKMQALALAMKDHKIAPAAERSARALSIHEGNMLIPLLVLYNYFPNYGHRPDFVQDWFEALRQNDLPEGSKVEKQSGVDKYELLASAQNDNKANKWAEFKLRYPESCWVKDGYITDLHHKPTENSVPFIFNFVRKASRLSGYNLYAFFEQWGFFRNVALHINDYGDKWYVMTEEMLREFKQDMEQLERDEKLQPMTPELILEISTRPVKTYERPHFPN